MNCPTAQGVATFDYAAWSRRYPSIAANVDECLACEYFEDAGMYLNNGPCSPVRDLKKRSRLLGMLVAHLALLSLPSSEGGNGGAVGRVSSASRGSVSISTDFGSTSERAAWFNQTQPGASFWAATVYLRQARYVPGFPQRPRIWP